VLTSVAPKGIKRPASNQLILEWYMQLKQSSRSWILTRSYIIILHLVLT
jgi:hypothetical protein